MRRNTNASSAGPIEGGGSRRRHSRIAALVLGGVLCLVLVLGASPASADTTATVDSVTDVSYASAHVTGSVDAVGETYWRFDYSSDGVNWVEGPGEAHGGPVEIDGSETFGADFTGLKGGTNYFVRIGYYNATTGEGGVSPEPNAEFTTLPVDPPAVLSIDDASGVSYTTAKASGEVERPANPDPAFDAQCNFEYVTEEQFAATGFDGAPQAPCETDPPTTPGVVSAPGASPVTANLTGLANGTTYHLRLTASNAGGSDSKEAASTFTTLAVSAPTVSIDPVTTFTGTTAHFSGQINPGGTDPAFGVNWEFHCTPECPAVVGGNIPADNSSHEVTADASGLEPNTTYEVELTATNAGGPESAGPESFKTAAVGPGAETLPAFALGGGTEALVGGRVNPRNSETVYWIEYGPDTDYGSSIPASQDASAGSGGSQQILTQKITGLTPSTEYHFRIVAMNAAGTGEGDDLSFETLPASAPPPAGCENDQLRSETSSVSLPECRAYEMVTPPDKNGGDAGEVLALAADGQRLGYSSAAGFANTESAVGLVPYLAQRSATGWLSRSMQVPNRVSNLGFNGTNFPADFTDELSAAVNLGIALAPEEPTVRNIFIKHADGSSDWVTKPFIEGAAVAGKSYAGRSADGSHIVFESSQDFGAQTNNTSQVWEWVEGEVRLVSRLPGGGVPAEGSTVGDGTNASATGGTTFNGALPQPTAVSQDGERIFFGLQPGATFGVYVREGGTQTRQLDLSQRSEHVGEAGFGRFQGAAADGSVAVFTSEAQLTDDAAPEGGLYGYDLESDDLRLLAPVPPGELQGRGVVEISDDGSRVYFVASRQLVPGRGVAGGHNLYLVDPYGLHFIAALGNDDDQNWSFAHGAPRLTVAATPSGRYFLFQSYERLTSFDNAAHREIYRFDAQTKSLTCVSCGNESTPASGDASMFPNPAPRGEFLINPYQGGRVQPMSDDGTRVLFQTTQALLPEDVNGLEDVYQYRGGVLELISTGTSKFDTDVAGITTDGRDIFLSTRDSLVAQDIDGGNTDIYHARVGGGFSAPRQLSRCATAETCNAPSPPPPGFATPPSTAPGLGNPHRRGKPPKRCGHKKKRQGKCGKKKQGSGSSHSGRNH